MWNSYLSVTLREEDMKYTVFVTPWGQYHYCCVPMGAYWAEDAFTQRYDDITKDVKDW